MVTPLECEQLLVTVLLDAMVTMPEKVNSPLPAKFTLVPLGAKVALLKAKGLLELLVIFAPFNNKVPVIPVEVHGPVVVIFPTMVRLVAVLVKPPVPM